MAALNNAQLQEAIAVLLQSLTVPLPNANATGIYIDATTNRVTIPDNAQNQASGSGLISSTDGVNLYFTLNPTDPGNGSGS